MAKDPLRSPRIQLLEAAINTKISFKFSTGVEQTISVFMKLHLGPVYSKFNLTRKINLFSEYGVVFSVPSAQSSRISARNEECRSSEADR